jgi:DNA primase
MRIPDTVIQQIKDSVDVVEIVGSYVQLKKRGRTYTGLCPFHHEKTPSFYVNPAMGIYKCFGCGAGGDAIHFLMEHEKYSYTEALAFLAEKYNIPISWEKEDIKENSETESLYIINQFAQQLFTQQLWETEEGKKALEYLYKRGLKTETIEKFQLGYSFEHGNTLLQQALKKQYEIKYLLETGLVKQNETTQQYYDAFKARIIFPIHTPSGKIAGFGGRTLLNDKKIAKYINSNESAVYHKSSIFYGLYFARTPIRKADEVILTEGYLDVISLHQAGVQNAIASSGTAFTEEQAQLLVKQTKNVTLFYDGDSAGKNAFLKTLDILLPYNAQVKTLVLPNTEDPDSFVQKHSVQEVQQYILTHREDALLHKLDYLYQQAGNDPNQRSKVQESILNSIALIPNPITQQEYVYHIAQKTNLSEENLFQQFQLLINQKRRDIQKQSKNTTNTQNQANSVQNQQKVFFDTPSHAQESEILRLLVLYGDVFIDNLGVCVFQILAEEITDIEEEIKNPVFRHIYTYLMKQYELHHSADLQPLIHHEDKNIAHTVIEILAQKYKDEYSEKWSEREGLDFNIDRNLPKSLQYAILYLRKKNIDALIKQNMQNLKNISEQDEEKIQAHLQIHQNLTLIRSNIVQELGIVIT